MYAASGFVSGAMSTAIILRLRIRRLTCPDPEAHELTAADHKVISDEFAVHATAVRRELSRYADALADGDGLLREQLRRFEAEV